MSGQGIKVTRQQLVEWLADRIENGTATLACYPPENIDEVYALIDSRRAPRWESSVPQWKKDEMDARNLFFTTLAAGN